MHVSNQSTVKFFVSNRPAKMKFLNAGSSLNKEQRFPGEPREKSGNKKEESSPHCWRMSYWYQHVSAGQIGAGTNVPVQYKVGTLVPVRHTSRH